MLTDEGIEVVERINADIDEAIAAELLKEDGSYDKKGVACFYGVVYKGASCPGGKWKNYRRFVIEHTGDYARVTGGYRMKLPEEFSRKFPSAIYSEAERQWVFPLAIVAHEMGHTRYGMGMGEEVTLAEELAVTDGWENPVRLMYGYRARVWYERGEVGEGESPLYGGTVELLED